MVNTKTKEAATSSIKPRWMKFRLRDDDEQVIRANAAEAGLSLSDYMRQMCRNKKIVIRQSKEPPPDLFFQVRKHGINLMQLLKEYRTRGHPPPGDLVSLFQTQQQFYAKLLEDVTD